MDIDQERFREFSRTKGKISYESEGNVDEKEYATANHINSHATIGYSAVDVDGKLDHIFVSRTAKGIVLTMPGDQTGAAPFPIEGYVAVSTVKAGSPVNDYYDAHVRAMAGDCPVADSAWLEKEVPMLPQRALDVTMKIFSIVCEQMEKMMSGMGNAMGEMMEGMGKAMGQAIEGMGDAVGEAMKGDAEAASKSPKKRAPQARKARPASKRKAKPGAKIAGKPRGRKA